MKATVGPGFEVSVTLELRLEDGLKINGVEVGEYIVISGE